MVSVVGFVIIVLYVISFIYFYSVKKLKQFKWIMFNASIIISIFFALGNAILGFSLIEFSMMLYNFTSIVTMVEYRERYINKKAFVSFVILLCVIAFSLINLIFNNAMPEVILMDTSIDSVFYGQNITAKAVFTSYNLYHLRVFLLMTCGLLLSTEYFNSRQHIEQMLNVIKHAFYVFFVFATIEFVINNAGYIKDFRSVVLSLLGNYDDDKVQIAQARFGYYGVTTFFPEPSYVSLMIIFLCISFIQGLRSKKEILWYIYGIGVIFMFGCTTSIMLLPFAVFIYIKEVIFSKSKTYKRVTFFKIFILIACISISVYIISQNFALVSEALSGTTNKLNAYLAGGGIYSTSGENSASTRNFGNHIALQAFLGSPLFGVGIGTTRGYGIITGMLANFGLLGIIAYLSFLNNIFKFRIKKRVLLLVILLLYFSTILSVWYSYYFTLIPIFALFSKNLDDRDNIVKEIKNENLRTNKNYAGSFEH